MDFARLHAYQCMMQTDERRVERPKRRKWIWSVLAVLVVLGCWFGRHGLERCVLTVGMWKIGPFFPPAEVEQLSAPRRALAKAQFYWDLAGFRVARKLRLKTVGPELKPLVAEIARRQKAGENMQYSMHLYREIRWCLNFTNDLKATRAKIGDLRASFNHPERQEAACRQDPADGSWGVGIETWYLRLYYSVEDGLKDDKDPPLRLAFLDKINSPSLLRAHLESLLHDDLVKTGVFNREELDETFSGIARLLFKKQAVPYPFEPGLKDALRDFVKDWQNPTTGCWGTWVQDREGYLWKMDDVAMTFHVVADFKGQVDHLDRIARRILDLDRAEFPAGIRMNGHYENHLNWDVIRILRYAWPVLDEPTRGKARAAISRFIDWCLAETYQANGSFKTSDLDETAGDANRYGVYLLAEAGFFSAKKRFWTDREFPEAGAIRERIMKNIEAIGFKDHGLKDAYETLRD